MCKIKMIACVAIVNSYIRSRDNDDDDDDDFKVGDICPSDGFVFYVNPDVDKDPNNCAVFKRKPPISPNGGL